MEPSEMKVKPIEKDWVIIRLSDGKDHIRWLEVNVKGGKDSNDMFKMVFVKAYAPTFGHLYHFGRISEEEMKKANEKGEFNWAPGLICGHALP